MPETTGSTTSVVQWAWLAPAFCAAAFTVIAVLGRALPRQIAYLSVLAILGGFVVFWYVLVEFLSTGGGVYSREWFTAGDVVLSWGIIVDELSIVMLGLVTFVALAVQVYSLSYMKDQPGSYSWFFAVHSLFAAAMLTLVLADNFLLLYIAWELVGVCSFLLIGFWYERRSAAEAAKKAFITTRIGDVGLLIGILLLFNETGTFDLTTIFHIAEQGGISSGTLTASLLLIFLGAMGKSAQFPLHVWLPDAMEGPTPVSALIHAATMVVAGVFLVARIFPLFVLSSDAMLVVAIIGLATALIAAAMALVMTDLKRVLAYSTISHLGFMMLALGAGGYTAAIFHLLAHAFAKALLFLGRRQRHPRHRQDGHPGHGRPQIENAPDLHHLCHRVTGPGGHPAIRRLLQQGRDTCGGTGRQASRILPADPGRRAVERAVHGPCLPYGLLRPAEGGQRARPRVTAADGAAPGGAGRAGADRRSPGPGLDLRLPGVRSVALLR